MEELRIYLFGGFLLERGGVAMPPIASRAGRSLFAYLVMNRGRPLQRDLLAGSFWPEMTEGRARRRLSHTLWQIQDVISEGSRSHLAVTADTMAFDSTVPYWLDVEEFDRRFEASKLSGRESQSDVRADASALKACVDLYRGDFMAGFFDDWAVADQDHYRQRYLVALGRLVDTTKANGAYVEALSYARRLTHHDSLDESAHQEVMRLCFLLGRTTEALQQFERCRSVLADELGSEPSEPTVELYKRIRRQRKAGVRPMSGDGRAVLLGNRPHSPFVGREEERRSLVDHLEKVLAGPGGVVLVEGEPGVGKSRLALEMAEDAEWRGFEVSWGRCSPGALRPFGPLVEVLESLSPLRMEQLSEQVSPVWLRETLRLAPGLSGPESPLSSAPLRPVEESARMREALVSALGALGRISPHLVILDDIQWADEDTLAVITQMGHRLVASRTLILLLYRSEEARGDPAVWDVLRDIDRSAGLGRLMLSPLSVFELGDMVKRILGIPLLEPSVAAHLHRRTGGNVLFALETLLALRDQGLFETGNDPASVLESQLSGQRMPVAPRVRSVIDSRMSLLGEEVASVYEVAAVCGTTVDIGLLSDAADLSRRTVLDAVDELLHRGLIRDEGDGRYQMAHDQVRQVVYERIEEQRRMLLHRRLAEILMEGDPEQVEAIGYHFGEAGVPASAATFLFKAGLRAEGLSAFATARQHFLAARAAAAETTWPSGPRYEVLAHLEGVLNVLGRRDEQHEVIEAMTSLAGDQPDLAGDLERRRSWLLAHTGDFSGAEQAARRSVGVEADRGDRSAVAASLVALGTGLRWSGRPLAAVPHLEAASAAAANDPAGRAVALSELGSTLVEVQRSDEALPFLDEALTIFRESGDRRGEAELAGIRARALRHLGDSEQAIAIYEDAIELCRSIGYRHGEGLNLVNLSALHHLRGDVAAALSGYDRAAQVFADLGNERGEAMVLANAASARHTLLGEDDRAHADAERALRHFIEIGDRARQAQCLEVLAGVAARKGRRGEARKMLDDSLNALAGTGNRFLEGQHLRSLALLQAGDEDHTAALDTLDRADRVCGDAGLEDLAVELVSIRGSVLAAAGRVAEALDLARKAVEEMGPGVERPYLVHHRHSLAARAAGEDGERIRAALEAHRLLEYALAGLSPEQRERANEMVPEHREIVVAAAALSPRTVQVRLPAVGAPTGRPLDDHDLRRVEWTVEHPADLGIASPIERRQQRLLRLLTEATEGGAVPSIEHLAEAIGVSESTVRRDLSVLRRQGHHVDTRGRQLRVS